MPNLFKLARPALFKIDPEVAHGLMIKSMKAGVLKVCGKVASPKLEQKVFGLTFKNPIGLAAGFDKNAEVVGPALDFGFGFVEVGTVTVKPQDGNPKPRIFRDPKNLAVINRMGFPNGGLEIFKQNIIAYRQKTARDGLVGINIGMNKDQTDAAADYTALIKALEDYADYLTVNISSPNTPGLRNLQEKDNLTALLSSLKTNKPLLVKLAPDLTEAQQEEIAGVLLEQKVSGVILCNTTLDRPDFLSPDFREQKGGLSGAPVRDKSTAVIRNFYRLTGGKLPIIGVGGISSAQHAYEKIKAGASLVQLYTGLVYEGPSVAHSINSGLLGLLEKDSLSSVQDAVGIDNR